MAKKELIQSVSTDSLFEKISKLIEDARGKVVSAVNLTMVYTNFEIGRYIVEEEQQGSDRAQYGKAVLKNLSKKLSDKYGDGFSDRSLLQMRQFFLTYSPSPINTIDGNIASMETPEDQVVSIPQTLSAKSTFTLSWSHYIILIGIKNEQERQFYEIEATQNSWSVRELNRQYSSSLYERLALSRDKDRLMELSRKGQILAKSEDVLKNPITLEFLGSVN